MSFVLDWISPPAASGLILDSYTASAAYSTRKLRTAYSGSAIRVRRSSDNTEQDIGFSGNELDTSALTTFVGANDGFVVTWYDQSGNARDVTQATTANQPQIVASGSVIVENTKPAIRFNGSSHHLTRTGDFLYDQGQATLVGAWTRDGVTGGRAIATEGNTASDAAVYRFAFTDGANHNFFIRNDANTQTANSTIGSAFYSTTVKTNLAVYSIRDTGSSVSAWKNNTLGSSTLSYTRSGTLTLANFTIGAWRRSGLLDYFDGEIAELIFMPTAIDTADRETIQTDLATYFGT